jgi:hypothetical protein
MHTLMIVSSMNKESICVISVEVTLLVKKTGGMMAGHYESSCQGEGKNV